MIKELMFFFFFFFFFLGLFLWHMKVPKLGVKSELLPVAYTTATAMPDPQATDGGQGSNLHPHGYSSDSFPLRHNRNSSGAFFYVRSDQKGNLDMNVHQYRIKVSN